MKNWRLPFMVLMYVVLGCTNATLGPSAQGPAASRTDRKGDAPAGIVVARFGQMHCRAKVGQAVHFPFGFTVVPGLMIHDLKVEVDGKAIDKPELFSPETNPGYGEVAYVFRPEHQGSYQVTVTPVYDFGDGAGGSWIVEVSEEGDVSVPSPAKREQ